MSTVPTDEDFHVGFPGSDYIVTRGPKGYGYLAGPMRGRTAFGFDAFHEAEEALHEQGWGIFSPARYDVIGGFDPTGLTGNEDLAELGFDLRNALAHDLAFITQYADAVFVLPGWEHSKGARAEVATARALGLPVIDAMSGEPIHSELAALGLDSGEVRVTNESGASKGSKRERHDLIPTRPLAALATHYGIGAEKYEPVTRDGVTMDNWRFGYPLSLSYAAMQRHARAFWSGEDIDPETGSPHLSAIAWHAFTMYHFLTEPGYDKFDDRQEKQA